MAKLKSKSKKFNLISTVWNIVKINLLPTTLFILFTILILITYQVVFMDKFFPFTFVGDTNITLLTKPQAIRLLSARFIKRVSQKLQFDSFSIDLATSSSTLDYSFLDLGFNNGHKGLFLEKFKRQLSTLIFTYHINPKIHFSLDNQIDKISKATYKPPQDAQLIFNETVTAEGSPSANIQIKQAKNGLEVDKEALSKEIENYLTFGSYQNQLPKKVAYPKITTEHVQKAKQALEKLEKQPIKLVFKDNVWVLDTKQLLTILDLTSGSDLLLDKNQTYLYLKKIASEIDQDVQEGLFEFNPETKRVSAFKPSQEGQRLDIDKSYQALTDALGADGSEINLPVNIIKPKIQTSDVNSLGIKELLGRGKSSFAGSIPNRIYNVNLTAQKINGVLVPPGETFSFNQTVGDITAATGFKQAYVIKEGRTVLDDGGGVCQDSTTLFRAVLNAGLPVIKRTAHAYRVGYYEQGFSPGLDATVFYPSVDFQFKNDTPAHILIQAYTVGITLYVDLYGSSDGRVSTISKSIVTNQTPPPPELRQDDPTLPKGTVKQVDFSAWGATVSFDRTVIKAGETLIQETWKSFYKPWQAIYLVGTQ